MTYENYDTPRDGVEVEQDPEAERIVSEIQETRSGMVSTIDEIGHRLQPQTIANEAREKIREATVGRVERIVDDAGHTAQRTGTTLMETIRQNPVPAALAGLGLGWLVLKMRDQSSSGYRTGNGYRYYGYGSHGQAYGNSGQAEDPMDRVRGFADGAAGRAQQVGTDVQRAAQSAADGTQETIQRAQWQAQSAFSDAQRQVDRTWNENPLALGALAVGVGAAVALALPETQKERELMGEQRDRLVEKVSTVATQALDEAQTKAQDVVDQVSEQVESNV